MKRIAFIAAALVALALLPVTLSFLLSGDREDELPAEEGLPAEGWRPAEDAPAGGAVTLGVERAPTFKGFESPRYQKFDRLIEKYVADFNAHPEKWAGSTAVQAGAIPRLTAAQVKAHMIQETGGGDVRSRAAWAKDPLQCNVPGDWNPYKRYLGLREPRKRNEGSLETNLKAGIMLLARKGFGVAGQPASNRPQGAFDGWKTALQRYNGRSDKAADGMPYREAYAARILDRVRRGTASEVEISIPTKRR